MNYEHSSQPRRLPMLELSEIDLSLELPIHLLEQLRAFAEANGTQAANLLYAGIDLSSDNPIAHGFGERRETWAFSDAEVEAASRGRASGDFDADSPFYYAIHQTLEPGVVLMRRDDFDKITDADEEYATRADAEYRLKPDRTFDDAVVGIMRITH